MPDSAAPAQLPPVQDAAQLAAAPATHAAPAAHATAQLTPAPPAAREGERVKVRGPLLRLLLCLVPANLSLYVLWGAIPTVLLPLQVNAIDPGDKVGALATVSTVGAVAAMVAQPLAGAVSDRTRSRFGRRAPWLVAGSLIGGLCLVGMALANGIVQLAIAWTCVQIAYNFVQAPLSAILPDRVPVSARGIFSALGGLASMIGAVGGQVLGASFAQHIGAGYCALAGFSIVMLTLLAVFNRDASNLGTEREPFNPRAFLRTFWISPTRHPDYFWAFLGRLLLYTGYFAVTGYNLYLLQDYIGLGPGATAQVAALGLIGLAATVPAIVIGGVVSDRLGRRKILVFISSALVAAGLVIPWAVPSLTSMYLMAIVVGFGFGAFGSVDQVLMTQVLPSEESFAKDLGVVNIAASLPQVLAPTVGGVIVTVFGYAGLFPVGIGLSLLGAFAVFRIRSVR
ncbi:MULTISPECIES: MFS transporter [Streptacidiphilus]|uniref:MFS transporter n=1 Tax=Streptacidiphilus cavernicola TaxID=3342716 RepID=A0ABV6URP3_9ACTN|nr:MFS transporter [Streptacidiphilus jeojiense]